MGLKPSKDSIFALFFCCFVVENNLSYYLLTLHLKKMPKQKEQSQKMRQFQDYLKKHYALTKQFCKQVED